MVYERMESVLTFVRDISYRIPLTPIVLTPEKFTTRLVRGDQLVAEMVRSGVEL